jgi:hypothetical protein
MLTVIVKLEVVLPLAVTSEVNPLYWSFGFENSERAIPVRTILY